MDIPQSAMHGQCSVRPMVYLLGCATVSIVSHSAEGRMVVTSPWWLVTYKNGLSAKSPIIVLTWLHVEYPR